MSRIRSIHPGIWTDEAFMGLTAHARLLLMGLWTEAWDDGVFEWKPLTLKARIFPVDVVDIPTLLSELLDAGVIARIEQDPKQPGVIKNFQKYQRPKKPNSSGMMRDEWLEFAGAKGTPVPTDDDNPEPVPNQFPTSTEKSPQMEGGGGKMEDEKAAAQLSVPRDLLDRLLEAAGVRGNPNPSLIHPGPIIALIRAGYDLEAEVIPAMRAKPKPDLRSWNWYVPIIREAADGNRQIASRTKYDPLEALRSWPDSKWQVVLDHSRQRREWLLTYGPAPGQAGCLVPGRLLKDSDREMSRVAA